MSRRGKSPGVDHGTIALENSMGGSLGGGHAFVSSRPRIDSYAHRMPNAYVTHDRLRCGWRTAAWITGLIGRELDQAPPGELEGGYFQQ